MTAAEFIVGAGSKLEVVTPERTLAPDVGGTNYPAYFRALALAGATVEFNLRLERNSKMNEAITYFRQARSLGARRSESVPPLFNTRSAQRKPKWRLEVLSRRPSAARNAPPILFVHGARHAAWCWDEYFLDYFAANGYAAHAVSLRGHGGSEGQSGLWRHRIRDYVDDVAAVAAALPAAPIVVGHSMGGFVVQKFLVHRFRGSNHIRQPGRACRTKYGRRGRR